MAPTATAGTASCGAATRRAMVPEMEASPPIYRREVVAMLFAVADLNANVERILRLLEEEIGGEEGLPEEDA